MLSATHNCACSFIMPPLEVSLVPLTEKHRASEINLQLLIRTQQTVRFSATDFYDAILIKHCSLSFFHSLPVPPALSVFVVLGECLCLFPESDLCLLSSLMLALYNKTLSSVFDMSAPHSSWSLGLPGFCWTSPRLRPKPQPQNRAEPRKLSEGTTIWV